MRKTGFSLLLIIGAAGANAAEGGASVYPMGVETVMQGALPGPHETIVGFFNDFYQANQLMGPDGKSAVPGFHLRVEGAAVKILHNWGLKVLGGTLVSTVGVPVLYEHLSAPFGAGGKTGLGNVDVEVASVAYHHGNWHWWYGADVFMPGASYQKGALLNVGQHYFAEGAQGAFTWLPSQGKEEFSSKFQYIFNNTDGATNYHSGNEFIWEYTGMRNVTKNLSIGAVGYFYKQTTDDLQNGVTFGDGNRGRDLSVGPQVRYHLGHMLLVAKYYRDTLVQNRPCGNSFWLQVGIPLHVEEN